MIMNSYVRSYVPSRNSCPNDVLLSGTQMNELYDPGSNKRPMSSFYDSRSCNLDTELERIRAYRTNRTPLSTKFPFDQCSDFVMKETKHSVDASIRQFIRSKTPIAFTGSLRSFLRETGFEGGHANVTFHSNHKASRTMHSDSVEQEKSSPHLHLETTESKHVVSPIIATRRPENVPGSVLISKFKTSFRDYLGGAIAMNTENHATQELLNFLTNLFVQKFVASGTGELCAKIIESYESGELEVVVPQLMAEMKEKHIERSFDNFQDVVSDQAMLVACSSSSRLCLENPRLYKMFKNIWKLNPQEILDFDLDMLLSLGSTSNDRHFTSMSLFQRLLNTMDEEAQRMNLVRFFYAYRREFRVVPNTVDPTANLSALTVSLRDAAETYMVAVRESTKVESMKNSNRERVRFVLEAVV